MTAADEDAKPDEPGQGPGEPAPTPEERDAKDRPARKKRSRKKAARKAPKKAAKKATGKPEPAAEPEPEPEPAADKEPVQEVEATPLEEGEAASGPTIDAPPPPGPEGDEARRTAQFNQWAMFTHLAGLGSIPFLYVGGILGPLIVWQIKDADEPGLAEHGKEAINFQINMLIWTLVFTAVAFVLSYVCCCFSWIPVGLIQVYNVALTVIAAVRANEGQLYRYPGVVRILD